MVDKLSRPSIVEWAGNMPKRIEEFVGRGRRVEVGPGKWSAERVRYSTPDGAEYVAICVPAFSPETVHRD